MQKLSSYFETEIFQRQALDAVASDGWLFPGGNLNLYSASWDAFDPSSSADHALLQFDVIYDELKSNTWQVFRPCSPTKCWPSRQVFETIKREFAEYSWGGEVNLRSFYERGDLGLESHLAKMQGIKRKRSYPLMTVSKFLHFYNPGLFPIYDGAVMREKVIDGRFRDDFRDFRHSENIPDTAMKEDTAAFLIYYMRWASLLLSSAHPTFMQVFVDWLRMQPGTELSKRGFDATTLYATAFEFTAIGAAKAEQDCARPNDSISEQSRQEHVQASPSDPIPSLTEIPQDMTPEAQQWRRAANDLGCTFYYSSAPGYSNPEWTIRAYAPDEDAFQSARLGSPHWFLLNDARADGPQYPLRIHHCDCSRLHSANTRDWPKVIAETREALEHWALKNRPDNPIVSCSTCMS